MQRGTYYYLVSDGPLKLGAHLTMRHQETRSKDKLPSDHKGWVISLPTALKAQKPRGAPDSPLHPGPRRFGIQDGLIHFCRKH